MLIHNAGQETEVPQEIHNIVLIPYTAPELCPISLNLDLAHGAYASLWQDNSGKSEVADIRMQGPFGFSVANVISSR